MLDKKTLPYAAFEARQLMANVGLLVGSVTGTAQSVAQALRARLIELGHAVELIEDGSLPSAAGPWLICTSTTGSGDIPENLWPFYQRLQQGMYLPEQRFAVLTLGDSAYPRFAQSGRDIHAALEDCAARALVDIHIIDAIYTSDPKADALAWLNSWVNLLNA
jgi:MioC protein